MKLKQVTALGLAAALGLTALTACGGSGSSTASSETASAAASSEATSASAAADASTGIEPCEVTFWHAMTGQQETTLTELADQFNAENEYGITVTLVNQGSYDDLSTKLTANAAAGTLPDMAQTYNSWLMPYLDMVVPLDDFIASDFDNYDDILQSYRDENTIFGFTSGLPFNKSTYVYFYNKTMFDELGLEAPTTWEDLVTIGETFMNEKNMVSLGYDDMAGMLEASLRQNGAEYVNEEGQAGGEEKEKEPMIYVTENGSVYHKDIGCSYLDLSISHVSKNAAEGLRNHYGEKYSPCETCGKGQEQGGMVYITETGNRYHTLESCSGLKRTVRMEKQSHVSGKMHACSRCG